MPSPIGAGLPGVVDGSVSARGASAILEMDGRYQLYTYDCDQGRCTGFATDLWRAIGHDQQQAYLDAVMDALVAAFPVDRGAYVVAIE
ncbi:MAG: hypothetical protein JO057_03335, partial [Chloroflexi bacterium]|nr:hypothetical protein [Chloroflexota bacterium]